MNHQGCGLMRGKKGISPLIATVLLIGLSVALAAVVITWGLEFVKSSTGEVDKKTEEALKCATQLDFAITGAVCEQGVVTVQNNGNIDIMNLTFRLYTGGDVNPFTEAGIPFLGVKQYTMDLTGVSKIEAVATVHGASGKAILCKDAIESYTAGC